MARESGDAGPDADDAARGDSRCRARLGSASVRAARALLLDGVSLAVNRGEFICVLGPNGAGKSTLLSLLNATRRPTSGRVQLLGQDVWTHSERARAHLRARIGTVLQLSDFNPLVPLTVAEVVGFGRTGVRGLLHRMQEADHAMVAKAMKLLAITDLSGREYRSLSGGEQQKAQIARALAQAPEMLLLDEPTAGLDVDWQERLILLVESLFSGADTPVVMTTHHTAHIPRCCTRVVLVRAGHVIFDGPPAEGLSAETLSKLYGCRIRVDERDGRVHCHSMGGLEP